MSLTFWIVIDPWYRKLCDTNIKSLFAPLLLSGASEKFFSCFFFFFFCTYGVCIHYAVYRLAPILLYCKISQGKFFDIFN
jgi:hypothetical protein